MKTKGAAALEEGIHAGSDSAPNPHSSMEFQSYPPACQEDVRKIPMEAMATETTKERQARMIGIMRKEPLQMAGSAVTTCPNCGTRFPDTGGAHWTGHCLMRLRRIVHGLVARGEPAAHILAKMSEMEESIARDGPMLVHAQHGLLDVDLPEFRDWAWDDTFVPWRPDGRRRHELT